jgi:hypothetical protein
VEGHGDQRDRLLLAGGEQDVEFALAGVFREVAAILMRPSVTPDMAETTATTWFPSSRVRFMRAATLRMRSSEPTEVPPYF